MQETNPSAIRERVARLLLQMPQADLASTHMVIKDGAVYRPANSRSYSQTRMVDEVDDAVAATLYKGTVYDPRSPTPVDTQRFRRWEEIMGPDWREYPGFTDIIEPFGYKDAARVLVYDDEQFALYVSVVTLDPDLLRPSTMTQLQAVRAEVSAAVVYAHRREQELLARRPTLVVRADGNVKQASRAAAEWLDPTRRSMIGSLVRGLDCRDDEDVEGMMDYARYRAVRTEGPSTEYVVMLDRPTIPSVLPDLGLTPRQNEVAELLAVGATVKEVATWLEISESTAKTHSREVYRRLGVSNRVELARVMADRS